MDANIKVINLGFVNAFLIRAKEGFLLIDTGFNNQWEKLEKELLDAGCLPDTLKLAIITHGDMDHTGNVPRLREKYKVKIAMHAGDLGQVENGMFLKRSVKSPVQKIMFAAIFLIRKLTSGKVSSFRFKPDILLSDGQRLDEYGVAAEIIHIPGHTPGSIGIITDEGDLLAGDTFVNRKKPEDAQIVENPAQLKSSLDRLLKINIKTVYPGHGKPFLMKEYVDAK